jgi:uncharacterized membrane protein YhaH (DUF805 family)
MDWKYLLFRFEGRINRKPYWLASLAVALVGGGTAAGAAFLTAEGAESELTLPAELGVAVILAVVAVVLFCSLAISVKRLHDRGKSGWWMALYYCIGGVQEIADQAELSGTQEDPTTLGIGLGLIGFAVAIWYLVDLGVLKGTPGPNQYGPDPLGGEALPRDASL